MSLGLSVNGVTVPHFSGQNSDAHTAPVKYENPVNKGMEYYGASIGSCVGSTVVALATGAATKFIFETKNKTAAAVGIIAGLGTLALTLPSTLYHKSVEVFAKKKEMDVYSRKVSAETSLAEQIDQQTKDKETPLSEAVKNYATFNIARTGKGVGIVSA